MKQIATIGLAVVPLLAGCAADTLGPGKAPETAQLDAQSIPNIQSQLKKLKWRVRSLKRQVSEQKHSGGRIDHNEIQEIKKRISELETLGFNFRSGPNAGASGGGALSPRAEARLASLESKLKKMEASQARTASQPRSGSANSSSAEAGGLRTDHAALAKRFGKLEQDLEKDRALVIDFLEDLDKRLSSLEEPSPGSSAPAQPKKP